MKKITKILFGAALCGVMAFFGGLMLTGCELFGTEEDQNSEIHLIYEMAVENGYEGSYDQWLATIKGDKGDDGESVELRVAGGYIQWKNTGDTSWRNLISVELLKGAPGKDGKDGVSITEGNTCVVTFNYGGVDKNLFDSGIDSIEIGKTERIKSLPKLKIQDEYFIGWFIEGTNKQIEENELVGENLTLFPKYLMAGLCRNGEYIYSWEELKTLGLISENKDSLGSISLSRGSNLDGNEYKLNGELILDKSTIRINKDAFSNCAGLKSITMPSGVLSLGDRSFENCKKLEKIIIPKALEDISPIAFYGCENLKEIYVSDENTVYSSLNNCLIKTNEKTLVLGCRTSQIPSDGSVTKIGSSAFCGCTGLEDLVIPKTITSIGYGAFDSSGLVSLTIPSSVIEMGSYVFADCLKLVKVDMYIQTVPSGTFSSCRSLAYVELGNNVKTIKSSAFYACSSLTNIELPKSLTTIEKDAFYYSGICDILIPENVTIIGANVFGCCNSLSCIQVSEKNTVYHSRGNCLISTQTKKIISTCKNSVIPKDDSVEKIGAGAFNVWSQRISLIMPKNIIVIEAFVQFGGNLEKIYYEGSSVEWGNIQIGNDYFGELNNATKYFYSSTQPSVAGNYWHYDTDGETPIEW